MVRCVEWCAISTVIRYPIGLVTREFVSRRTLVRVRMKLPCTWTRVGAVRPLRPPPHSLHPPHSWRKKKNKVWYSLVGWSWPQFCVCEGVRLENRSDGVFLMLYLSNIVRLGAEFSDIVLLIKILKFFSTCWVCVMWKHYCPRSWNL